MVSSAYAVPPRLPARPHPVGRRTPPQRLRRGRRAPVAAFPRAPLGPRFPGLWGPGVGYGVCVREGCEEWVRDGETRVPLSRRGRLPGSSAFAEDTRLSHRRGGGSGAVAPSSHIPNPRVPCTTSPTAPRFTPRTLFFSFKRTNSFTSLDVGVLNRKTLRKKKSLLLV